MEDLVTTGGVLHSDEYTDIVNTICDVFGCKQNEITEIKALQKGLPNIVLSFKNNGGKYVCLSPSRKWF